MQLLSAPALLLDAVARAGSFRRAADRLNLSASAINRQVLKLEAEAGLPLFERLPRGVRPTAAGERILADIRRWRHEQVLAEGQLRDLTGQRRGSITIGALQGFDIALLPEAIKLLRSAHPLIEVDVQISGSEELQRKLAAKEIDVALIFNPAPRLAADVVFSLSVRPGVAMAVNHPLALNRSLRLSDGLRYGFVLPDHSIGIRKLIEAAFAEAHIEVAAAVTTNSITLMKSMLRLGQNLAILSIFDVHSEVTRGELAFAPIVEKGVQAETLVIALPLNRRPSPAVRALVETLRGIIRTIQETLLHKQ